MVEITQQLLHDYFEYQDDGHLYRKHKTNNGTSVGRHFGGLHKQSGYITGKFFGYAAEHRLIFMYHHGYFPKEIDHINKDRADNRIENLRDVNRTQNKLNTTKQSNNKSQYKNVVYRPDTKQYRSWVSFEGHRINMPNFDTAKEASKYRDKVARLLHGEYYSN